MELPDPDGVAAPTCYGTEQVNRPTSAQRSVAYPALALYVPVLPARQAIRPLLQTRKQAEQKGDTELRAGHNSLGFTDCQTNAQESVCLLSLHHSLSSFQSFHRCPTAAQSLGGPVLCSRQVDMNVHSPCLITTWCLRGSLSTLHGAQQPELREG